MQFLQKTRLKKTLTLRFAFVPMLLLTGLSAPRMSVYAAPTGQQPEGQTAVIQEMVVAGNKNLSKSFVLKASGYKVGDPFSEETGKGIRSHLFATGYFGAHSKKEEDIIKVTSTPVAPGKCRVIITVDENDLLTGVNLTGTGPLKPDAVLPLFHLKPGEVYNDKQFLMDALDLQKFYLDKGYIITIGDAALDKKGTLNIRVLVTRVAEITITGNQKTAAKDILAVLTTRTGEYLNIKTLDKDKQMLLSTPQLNLKDVKMTDKPIGSGRVALTVSVVEK